jgi:hypothetical protein
VRKTRAKGARCCGGFVFFTGAGLPGLIGVNAGALDGEDVPAPRRLYWSSRRHDWLGVPDCVEAMERQ